MKITPQWLREFVNIKVDDRQLAEDLTLAGVAVESISGSIFEMEITTNRVDAMNHYGIAREASAIYDLDLKPITATLPTAKGKSSVSVSIEVREYCARFTGQEIRNVKIGPAQASVQKRFAELEQKPINNAADATNYVTLEVGKPTHAFDLDKLAGRKIIVRMAKPGETLKTLDGVERKLHPEDVVVADAEKPVALAGVIGGWDSMITETTQNIFIESAWWDPAVIRKTSRRHGIHTDASHRFERGADWASCAISCDRVSELILESGSGELIGEKVDVIARAVSQPIVTLSHAEITRILGKEIPVQEIVRILTRLGFRLTPKTAGAYSVEIPSWRLDVEREIDLIEEIARIHGYNNFPNTLPGFSGGLVELPETAKNQKVRSTLLALGYNEALSSTFVAKSESQTFSTSAPVEIANPLSEEAAAMRTSLMPGMLDMLGRNLNRGTNLVRLFEHGHIYSMQGEGAEERDSLCIGVTADAIGENSKDATATFRRLKGDIESVLSAFSCNLCFDQQTPGYFHPGRSALARLNGTTVARFGQIHPEIAGLRKLKQDAYLAEFMLQPLYQNELHVPRYERISRFPAVERDFSFLFDDSVTFERIRSAIEALNISEIQRLEPVELFRGGPNIGSVPTGRYSTLLRVNFQASDRTLRDDEVAAWSAQITEALKNLGGTHRA